MITKTLPKLAAVALAVCAATAGAATVTDSASYSGSATWGSQALSFDKFDSSLGTLTGISITWDWGLTGNISAENTTPTYSGTFQADGSVSFSVAGITGVTGFGNKTLTISDSREVTFYDGNTDYAGTSGFAVTGLSDLGTRTASVAAGSFSSYIGSAGDQYNFSVNALSGTAFFGPGNGSVVFSNTAISTFTVTYTYTEAPPTSPVPEPETYMLFLGGLAAIGAAARRRRVK